MLIILKDINKLLAKRKASIRHTANSLSTGSNTWVLEERKVEDGTIIRSIIFQTPEDLIKGLIGQLPLPKGRGFH